MNLGPFKSLPLSKVLKEIPFRCVLMKEASCPDKLLVDVKTFCGMTLPKVECSNVVYLLVVDLHVMEYGIGEFADYPVLVDQKTYVRICELKQECGTGSFHLLVTGTFFPTSVCPDACVL